MPAAPIRAFATASWSACLRLFRILHSPLIRRLSLDATGNIRHGERTQTVLLSSLPAWSNYVAAIQEFSVSDAPSFDRRSPVRWVLDHIRRYPALPFIFIVTVIGMAASQSLAAVFIGRAFDVIAGGGGAATLSVAALSVLAAWVTYGLCDVGNSWSLRFLAQRVERDAREELYLSLLGKSQSFHGRRQVGELMARATNDVQQLNLMIAPHAGLILEAVVTLVVPLITIALIRVELLLIPLLYVLGFLFSLRNYGAQLRPLADAMRSRFGKLNAGLAEAISGVEVVHSFAQEPVAARRFADDARAYRDVFVREGDVQARYLPLLFYGICLGLGFGHALLLFMRGELTVGQVITFMALFDTLRFPTLISITTVSQVQLGLAGAERILDLINTEGDLDQNRSGHNAPIRGDVQFEDVSFDYVDREGRKTKNESSPANESYVLRPSSSVLEHIAFNIAAGETVALIGQTGAGKTTLARLVNRTFDVSAGRILIDGIDVRDWDLDALRSQIATIEQDIFLFSRSIAENIAFGARGPVTPAQIEQAARQAEAHEFISALPAGYNTVIGERGVTLSGGQRQRLAIARAFLSNPRILIIDDSTSALDSATEDRIQRAMTGIMQGRTTILITHRLSQIRRADKVLLLKNGTLSAAGSHTELLASSPLYKHIFGI
jgi:ATP-binding cassette, subfamily B, bacterial